VDSFGKNGQKLDFENFNFCAVCSVSTGCKGFSLPSKDTSLGAL